MPDVPEEITVYPIIKYKSVTMAQDAFLDMYVGEAGYDRYKAAQYAGIESDTIIDWFKRVSFIDKLERRLQETAKRKNNIVETIIDESQAIMEGNIADIFETTETGSLAIRNIKSLPRHITAAIKQMDVVRVSVPGNRFEVQECVRIVMHDKTKVLNILADYSDVKNVSLRRQDTGGPKMVGLTLTTALPTQMEEIGDEVNESGEVSAEHEADADS